MPAVFRNYASRRSSSPQKMTQFALQGDLCLPMRKSMKWLEDLKLMDQTLTAMATAFEKAQIVRRGIEGNLSDLRNRMGRKESIEAMSREVSKVLVVGCPTRTPYFIMS